jgi:hypothetical protein
MCQHQATGSTLHLALHALQPGTKLQPSREIYRNSEKQLQQPLLCLAA